MATVDSVHTGLYRVPLPDVLTDSTHGTMTDFELVTARVRDADGAEGLGYTYTVNHGGTAVHAMIERDLAPALTGQDADAIEACWQKMWWTLHYGGRGGHATSAISALDIALWDLKAKRAGLPLWRLWGGYDPAVPVYAGGIDLELPLSRLLEQADDFREQGFRAVKMKVGRSSLRDDVERVAAMRDHLGADFPLMADANMRWSVDEALRAARALAPFDLVWIEEPTIPDDVAGHARIVAQGGLPVATGENLHTLYEFQQMIAAGGVTFPEPDVSNCGGYTVFRKICALAEAANLPVTSHGVHDLTVHALAAVPHRSYMEAHGFGLDAYMLNPPLRPDGSAGGKAVAPERPGHGVELDFDKLQALGPSGTRGTTTPTAMPTSPARTESPEPPEPSSPDSPSTSATSPVPPGMPELFDLTGLRAVVTGCRRGIGLAMAEALAQAGADIVGVSAGLEAQGSDAERAVTRHGRRFAAYRVDFADPRAVARFAEDVERDHGPVDILVNNAGTIARHPAADYPDEDWDHVVQVDLSSQFVLSRELGRRMVRRGRGKIVFTASVLSFQGGVFVPAYAAAKSGLTGLTKALANEWAASGVCVNAIAPGYVVTDNTEALYTDPDRSAAISGRIPAGRWGRPDDLAGATVFLASPASDYVHGTVLPVDGGWLGR